MWDQVYAFLLSILVSFGLITVYEPWKPSLPQDTLQQQMMAQEQEQLNALSNVTIQPDSTLPKGSQAMLALPLGDYKYNLHESQKGSIFLCRDLSGGGGAQADGDWIHGTVWTPSEKIAVGGTVAWPTASISISEGGDTRIITTNNLPKGHTTGVFPILSSDPAYRIDRNPNSIKAQNFTFNLPLRPQRLASAQCVGGEVGVMLSGVLIFNGFDAQMRDAGAHEVQDLCAGHPQMSGIYHYHNLSPCFRDISVTTVLGFAFDGFPITGPKISEGRYLTTNDLDECHGTESTVWLDGKAMRTYHYVMTQDFPYSVGCFRGRSALVAPIGGTAPAASAPQLQGISTLKEAPKIPQGGSLPHISACLNKSMGSLCTFTGQDGAEITGTCQAPPGGGTVGCQPLPNYSL